MEGTSSRPSRKRSFVEDDDGDDSKKSAAQKRVRFPRGKKVKIGDAVAHRKTDEDDPADLANPRVAAKERAKRRNQITADLFSEESRGLVNDISAAEETYEVNENFVDEGIQIEPFNLDKEREEGYFDADGNFVEYVNDNEIKDAWLDSVEAEPKYTGKDSSITYAEVGFKELSSEEVGKIKRRIADLLEPGETVLQALRRLKGTSNDRKQKMPAETKRVFDQLTEDAMKLMDNGDYNVYHEKQEVFEREAEGYETLARARQGGTSISSDQGNSDPNRGMDWLSDIKDPEVPSSVFPDPAVGTLNPNESMAGISGDGGDAFDMFADDDEGATGKPSSNGNVVATGCNFDAVSQQSSDTLKTDADSGATENDYIYDESTGYYYSSSLGYYYDPFTGLYCSAVSGKWFLYSEETGTYNEIHEVASNTN